MDVSLRLTFVVPSSLPPFPSFLSHNQLLAHLSPSNLLHQQAATASHRSVRFFPLYVLLTNFRSNLPCSRLLFLFLFFRLLLMVPIYGIVSFFSYVFYQDALYFELIRGESTRKFSKEGIEFELTPKHPLSFLCVFRLLRGLRDRFVLLPASIVSRGDREGYQGCISRQAAR